MIFQYIYADVLILHQFFIVTGKGLLAYPQLFVLSFGFLRSQMAMSHSMPTLAQMWEKYGVVKNVWRWIRELEEGNSFWLQPIDILHQTLFRPKANCYQLQSVFADVLCVTWSITNVLCSKHLLWVLIVEWNNENPFQNVKIQPDFKHLIDIWTTKDANSHLKSSQKCAQVQHIPYL